MIKIAEGTYRKANEKGILTLYINWCKLKGYNSHGTVGRDKESMENAAVHLGVSLPTIRNYFKHLVRLGFMRRHRYSYSLVSYDTAWDILGMDTSEDPVKMRKGSFRIFKISGWEDLKEKVEMCEIMVNVNKQAYRSREQILKNTKDFSDSEKKTLKECRFSELHEKLDRLYVDKLSVLKMVEGYLGDVSMIEYCNAQGIAHKKFNKITPYPTCVGMSRLLGYEPNPKTGERIRERLEKAGIAKFITRKQKFLESWKMDNGLKAMKLRERYPNRVQDDGFVATHRLISKMVVL